MKKMPSAKAEGLYFVVLKFLNAYIRRIYGKRIARQSLA